MRRLRYGEVAQVPLIFDVTIADVDFSVSV